MTRIAGMIGRLTIAGVAGAALGLAGGCDDGGSSSATAGNPINNLSDAPQSLPGRSAGLARDVAEQAAARDAEAIGVINSISGGGGTVTVAGLSWTVPDAWLAQQPGMMREAQYEIPGGGLVYWSHFAGAGGDVQSNIDRWAGQVLDLSGNPSDPEVEERTVAGVPVTLVSMEGTFLDGPPGGQTTERRRWGFRGAIIEGPRGTVFIKFVGPRDVVSGAEGLWEELVSGMRQ